MSEQARNEMIDIILKLMAKANEEHIEMVNSYQYGTSNTQYFHYGKSEGLYEAIKMIEEEIGE